MSPLFFTLLLFLSSAPLYALAAELGPAQICRCYPVGTTGLSTDVKAHYYPPPVCAGGRCPQAQKCMNTVKVDISVVADDGVSLYICGIKVRQSSHFDELQRFTYEGKCDDFMLEVTNTGLSSGVAVLATVGGHKYGTTDRSGHYGVPGTIPLYAIAKFQPTGNWFPNPPDYDFSSWTPAVVVQSRLGIGDNFNMLARQGAYPISVQSGDVPKGIYGLKLLVPWCGP